MPQARPLTLIAFAAQLVLAALVGGLTPPTANAARATDPLLAPVASCPGSDAPSSTPQAAMREMACLVRYARTQAGLAALKETKVLDRAGTLKIVADLKCNDFTHTPCGQPFQSVFAAAGYSLDGSYSVGENLAYGQDELGSPQQIMLAWLSSPEHRANLLAKNWNSFGLAVRAGTTFLGYDGVTIWASEFAGSAS